MTISSYLDVDDVRFVINYDYPTSDAVYIHRIGRTGRSSQCGTAFTFFSNEDARHAPALIRILDEADSMVHPIILQLGRKNGFNKWVKHVGSKIFTLILVSISIGKFFVNFSSTISCLSY